MPEEKTALVIGSGGARCGFALGAIRHLARAAGLDTRIITATSGGALIAVKLAEARNSDELLAAANAAIAALEEISEASQIFRKQPWLADLANLPLDNELDELVLQRHDENPNDQEARDDEGRKAGLGRAFGIARVVGELIGDITRIPEARHEFKASPGSLLDASPLREWLHGHVDPGAIQTPGLDLRIATCDLSSGEVHYVTEAGMVVGDDAQTPVGPSEERVEIIDALMASAAMPGIFAPAELAGRTYVDGGIRQVAPVDAALNCGATKVYTILNLPLEVPASDRDWPNESFAAVLVRGLTGIMPHAVQRGNLLASRPGVENLVIAPTLSVGGRLDLDPDTLKLSVDYGALRAADVLAGLDTKPHALAIQLSDTAITMRMQRLNPRPGAADPSVTDWIVARCLDRRKSLGIEPPENGDSWYESAARPGHDAIGALGLPQDALDALDIT